MKKILLASLLSALSIGAANAQVTSNFQSTSTIASKCEITAQNINFGPINPFTTSFTAAGGIEILCSKGVSYSIGPDGGYNVSGNNPGHYQMMSGMNGNTDGLIYRLYNPMELGTKLWHRGAQQPGSGPIEGIGTGSVQSHSITATYGASLAVSSRDSRYTNATNNTAVVGDYVGTVTAIVTY